MAMRTADPWALQPGTGTRKGKSQTFLYLLTTRLNRSHHHPTPHASSSLSLALFSINFYRLLSSPLFCLRGILSQLRPPGYQIPTSRWD